MSEVASHTRFVAHVRDHAPEEQSLENHLMGVSRLAAQFASKIGLTSQGELIGLLHDLGKYSVAFQNYLKSAVGQLNQDEDEDWVDAKSLKGKIDHSTAGAQYIWQELAHKGPLELRIAQVLALCIASHHSGLIDCLDADGQDTFGRRISKAREKTHLSEACQSADASILIRCAELLKSTEMISDFRVLVVNIFTDDERCPVVQQNKLGLAVRFLFSCLIDADRIDTADFEHNGVKNFRPNGSYVSWPILIERLERHLTSMSGSNRIDGLRKDISKHCLDAAGRPRGKIYTLTVPTGGGKTLASLRFALHHAVKRNEAEVSLDRIIYVIPFTSIIDQNAQVIRAILEPEDVPGDSGKIVLEHHASITPEQQTWREKTLCENWDAPIVYTTMVQFLESLFGAGTRGARRMHQLANSVIIFDEIQTLPIKCVHLFNNAINFLANHCNSTVVLCTATQPLLHEVSAQRGAIQLAPGHEIMPAVQDLFDSLKRVEVRDRRKHGGWTSAEVAELALAELARTGSCLVIVNTKNAAKELYILCQARLRKEEVFHLSTDMCPAHRKAMLGVNRNIPGNTVIRRLDEKNPVLCISTQLIEAGVDVDFGVVIRFNAGLDSIAQAAGRCNRNARSELGIVHVVNPQKESLEKLPDILKGRNISERLLDDYRIHPDRYRDNIFGPEALHDYYNYYFFQRQGDMSYAVSAKEIGHDDTLLSLLSHNERAFAAYHPKKHDTPNRLLYQSFMTAAKAFKAIDAPTRAVVVPYGEEGRELIGKLHGAYDVELEYELLRAAQQYTVNVFHHVLGRLKEMGAVKEVKPETRILTLDGRYYSSEFGLATEPVSLMENLNV